MGLGGRAADPGYVPRWSARCIGRACAKRCSVTTPPSGLRACGQRGWARRVGARRGTHHRWKERRRRLWNKGSAKSKPGIMPWASFREDGTPCGPRPVGKGGRSVGGALWTWEQIAQGTLNVSDVCGRETRQLSLAAAGEGQHDVGGFFNPGARLCEHRWMHRQLLQRRCRASWEETSVSFWWGHAILGRFALS